METAMRFKLVFTLLVFAFLNCNTKTDVPKSREIIENALTLELSFGADEQKLPVDYLLDRPHFFAVNNEGDVIVSDNQCLKVFDSGGNPKRILGRPGQGPGEFAGMIVMCPVTTETGYISAVSDGRYLSYNIYAPDYTFVDLINFQFSSLQEKLMKDNNWTNIRYNFAYCYSPDEFLMRIIANEISETERTAAVETTDGKAVSSVMALVYKNGENIENIYAMGYPVEKGNVNPERGRFHFDLLPDRRVVYTFAAVHKTFENGKWYYSLFVHDLKNLEKVEIKKPYTPVAIPDSVIYYKDDAIPRITNERIRNRLLEKEKERSKKLKELKFYAAVKQLLTDGDFIFVFTFEFNEENKQVVEIIDSGTGKLISSAYFPFEPQIIKNGYAYKIGKNEEGFYVIEKYKIDPAVYGK